MSRPILNAKLGRYIRRQREVKGLTLRELENATGVQYSTIAKIEMGQVASPRADHLNRLAKGLDVSAHDLLRLAGYTVPEGLPDFAPYLRAKFDLPDQAVNDLEEYFRTLREQYGVQKGGRRAKRRA